MNKIEILEKQDDEAKKEIKSLFGKDDSKSAKRKHGLAIIRFFKRKQIKKLKHAEN